ncbi:MAG: DUF3310 domain-containing protein [Candidatus Pacebacteria bacterium]|jgi:hypothetical protein|nr:DUF3310 domain-containing protein [Candidatus Paceibacterota bacterium]
MEIFEGKRHMSKPIVVNQAGLRILIDPDDPERRLKPVVKYRLAPEEIERRYGCFKRQPVGSVILGPDSDRIKQIRIREREEREMSIERQIKSDEAIALPGKLTKEIAKNLIEAGYLVDEITDRFTASYPNMSRGLLKAKVTRLLSDNPGGKAKTTEQHIAACEERSIVAEVTEYVKQAAEEYKTQEPEFSIKIIDFLKDKLTPEQFEGFCIGNAIDCLSEYRYRGGLYTVKKAAWYIDNVIKAKEAFENEAR